ncbi:MAG: hypothetical protein J6O40_04365 [Ruminococcus sp.]|nr:hypothetical protein [Ruminococcus sp.]
MEKLFKSYQTLVTDIENRISLISLQMKAPRSGEEMRLLRKRKDMLREEYDDLIFAMHKMSKYTDKREKPPIRREAASN